jgi:hypothetical protein
MDARVIERTETTVERLASAVFGVAVGYAVYEFVGAAVPQAQLLAYAGAAGIAGWFLSARTLSAFAKRSPRYPVPIFDVRNIEPNPTDELLLTDRLGANELVLTSADRIGNRELILTDADRLEDELLLTESDRLKPAAAAKADPLVLDDVLHAIETDSRVVRMFDRKAMPTPGQLRSQIDDHLGQAAPSSAQADAAKALSDALAELRRSLR